jgi:hypothetical protein
VYRSHPLERHEIGVYFGIYLWYIVMVDEDRNDSNNLALPLMNAMSDSYSNSVLSMKGVSTWSHRHQ